MFFILNLAYHFLTYFTSFFLNDFGLYKALVNMLKGSCLGCCFYIKYFLTTPFKKISAYLLLPILTVSYFILLFLVHLFSSFYGESTAGKNIWLFFIFSYFSIYSLNLYFYFCL